MNKTGSIYSFLRKGAVSALSFLLVLAQIVPDAYAQGALYLPAPGSRVELSSTFNPPVLKGIKVHPDDPFRFEFLLDKGDSVYPGAELKDESNRLIKYFLASLTVPETDLWVNLSPYEKDRIIPDEFGRSEMGRDLLAQDYLLKQVTASAIYPESEAGKKFWAEVYRRAAEQYGTTDIPVDTFNKVWIVPAEAEVFENGDKAFVVASRLKVMLESDYVALDNAVVKAPELSGNGVVPETQELTKNVIREIVLPLLEKEVNEGRNFTRLRQVYQSLILAAWYKKKVKASILSKVYVDQKKVAGVNIDDPKESEKIWGRYVEAFKKGAFNYIKEERDVYADEMIPRKYFSGGVNFAMSPVLNVTASPAQMTGGFSRAAFLGMLVVSMTLTTFNNANAGIAGVVQAAKDPGSAAVAGSQEIARDRVVFQGGLNEGVLRANGRASEGWDQYLNRVELDRDGALSVATLGDNMLQYTGHKAKLILNNGFSGVIFDGDFVVTFQVDRRMGGRVILVPRSADINGQMSTQGGFRFTSSNGKSVRVIFDEELADPVGNVRGYLHQMSSMSVDLLQSQKFLDWAKGYLESGISPEALGRTGQLLNGFQYDRTPDGRPYVVQARMGAFIEFINAQIKEAQQTIEEYKSAVNGLRERLKAAPQGTAFIGMTGLQNYLAFGSPVAVSWTGESAGIGSFSRDGAPLAPNNRGELGPGITKELGSVLSVLDGLNGNSIKVPASKGNGLTGYIASNDKIPEGHLDVFGEKGQEEYLRQARGEALANPVLGDLLEKLGINIKDPESFQKAPFVGNGGAFMQLNMSATPFFFFDPATGICFRPIFKSKEQMLNMAIGAALINKRGDVVDKIALEARSMNRDPYRVAAEYIRQETKASILHELLHAYQQKSPEIVLNMLQRLQSAGKWEVLKNRISGTYGDVLADILSNRTIGSDERLGKEVMAWLFQGYGSGRRNFMFDGMSDKDVGFYCDVFKAMGLLRSDYQVPDSLLSSAGSAVPVGHLPTGDTKGGIDLNADKLGLVVRNQGGEITFNIDPVMLQRLQDAEGFSPVIMSILPAESLQQFLGIQPNAAGGL